MNVLVVGDSSSVNVQRWCEGLRSNGLEVRVVSFSGQWREDIPVIRLPLGWTGRARYLLLAPLMPLITPRADPDAVVGYFVTGYGTLARWSLRRPLVQVTAGDDVLETPSRSWAGRLAVKNLAAADLVVAWAEHMARAAERFGVRRDRIFVQCRGVPLEGYSARPVEPPVGNPPRAIVTRSLRPEYRHDLLFEALTRCKAPVHLTVVGDGPERGSLEARARRLGCEHRIEFTGRVRNDELPALLARHDVYVSVSSRDGVSASLLEAMAAGLVPVVTDHPANSDWVIDGRNGLLVSTDHATLVAAAIDRAATDVELQQRAREMNPRIIAERGDLQRNMTIFASVLHELSRTGRGPQRPSPESDCE